MNNDWVENEFKQAYIRDERLTNRLTEVVTKLAKNPQTTLPQALGGWKETRACYRMLDNKKLSSEVILSGHRNQTIERMKNHETVLVIQDTTTLDFSHHPETEGIGLYSQSESKKGLLLHSSLAVTTNGVALGLLSQKYWSRECIDKTRDHNLLPIEEKESYKWLETMDASLYGIPQNVKAVTVADREADIYEFFLHSILNKNDVLVRMTKNRRIVDDNANTIEELIGQQPSVGEYVIQVPRNTRENVPARQARIQVKVTPITIRPPKNKASSKGEPNLNLYVIMAEETSTPPKGVKPIKWILVTNIKVDSLEKAIEIIGWYSQRWKIERFHYVLKSGCNIDEIQLTTGERLEKAIAIYSIIAWKILMMTYISRINPNEPCNVVFKEHEWQALWYYVNRGIPLPKKPPTIHEASRMVASLGGFLGRKSDGNPGVKVLWRGMARLNDMVQMYLITQSPAFSKLMDKA
jgi:hypothetical protein